MMGEGSPAAKRLAVMVQNVCSKIFSLLFLPFSLFLMACQADPSITFDLKQTEAAPLQETRTVAVDNCGALVGKVHWYEYPFAVGSLGVENLVPNGGEPFSSIRKRIQGLYGQQAGTSMILYVPPGTRRKFTVTASIIKYRGTVTGQVIDENKAHPDQDAVYYYPFLTGVLVSGQQDIACP